MTKQKTFIASGDTFKLPRDKTKWRRCQLYITTERGDKVVVELPADKSIADKIAVGGQFAGFHLVVDYTLPKKFWERKR